MDQFDSAYFFFHSALNTIKPGIDENELVAQMEEYVNANKAEFVAQLVLDKADAFLQEYLHQKKATALQTALHIYKTADQLLSNIRSEQSEFASKLFWRSYTPRRLP